MIPIDSAALPGTPPASGASGGVPVHDLRGIRSHDDADPILLDVTGRRARRLRRGGRVVGVLFLGWFCGLILAGLGLLPADQLPFAAVVGPASSPSALASKPRPAPVPAADLRPAAAASAGTAGPAAASATSGRASTTTRPGAPSPSAGTVRPKHRPATATLSPAVPVAGKVPASSSGPAPATSGKATAPGAAKHTSPVTGAPVTTTTTSTTTTTTPGSSASAPGHATTRPGHGTQAITP